MQNRRNFLKSSLALPMMMSGGSMLGTLAGFNAQAADTSSYRALVCVFLFGGMDCHDTVLPYDPSSYDDYASLRASLLAAYAVQPGGSTRSLEALLALDPSAAGFGSRQFALPPQLAGLHQLFEQGSMAIVGNVGPLKEPTDSAGFAAKTAQLPPRLFSHNDQQSTWMSFAPEGSSLGWGGRFGDAAAQSNANAGATFAQISLDANDTLDRALQDGSSLSTAFPDSDLGAQLRTVAQTIAVRETLGVSRQVFLVDLHGFDTHSAQATSLPALQQDIGDSIAAFYTATQELAVANEVTTFTAADFGRTLTVNGDGTDHGWGSHHFVVGGAVNGGDIYGDIPVSQLGHGQDAGNGRLIPAVSVEQFAAPLGSWFGLNQDELNAALPGLANFPAGPLGFI